tara:strand:+ start:135 stop:626 length:492 start_codon:yes stop_codon:yes gene_type:complete
MLIRLKNKDTLIIDDFKLKCCIGKKGLKKNKIEGDKSTPKGIFTISTIYYRKDKVDKPFTNLKIKIIKQNMGWCNDPNSKFYNKEIKINKSISLEKLYRKDYKYNYLVVINYNTKKTIPYKGSAIFIHLTNNYNPTAGCIALKKKDLLILLKLINKKTKIKIN